MALSCFEIKRKIEELRMLSLQNSERGMQIKLLNDILTDLIHPIITLKNKNIYRFRWNEKERLFEHRKELIYPRNDLAKKGRLNDTGQSVFYAAACELGTIIELEPKIGTIFTISKFRLHSEPPLFIPIGIKNKPYQSPYKTMEQQLATNFINSEITKTADSEDDYNLSALMGRHFFEHRIKHPNGTFSYAGIVYSSVESTLISNVTTYNIAMTPSFFDDNYSIEESICYVLTNEYSHFQLNKLNEATVNESGNLKWTHTLMDTYFQRNENKDGQ